MPERALSGALVAPGAVVVVTKALTLAAAALFLSACMVENSAGTPGAKGACNPGTSAITTFGAVETLLQTVPADAPAAAGGQSCAACHTSYPVPSLRFVANATTNTDKATNLCLIYGAGTDAYTKLLSGSHTGGNYSATTLLPLKNWLDSPSL